MDNIIDGDKQDKFDVSLKDLESILGSPAALSDADDAGAPLPGVPAVQEADEQRLDNLMAELGDPAVDLAAPVAPEPPPTDADHDRMPDELEPGVLTEIEESVTDAEAVVGSASDRSPDTDEELSLPAAAPAAGDVLSDGQLDDMLAGLTESAAPGDEIPDNQAAAPTGADDDTQLDELLGAELSPLAAAAAEREEPAAVSAPPPAAPATEETMADLLLAPADAVAAVTADETEAVETVPVEPVEPAASDAMEALPDSAAEPEQGERVDPTAIEDKALSAVGGGDIDMDTLSGLLSQVEEMPDASAEEGVTLKDDDRSTNEPDGMDFQLESLLEDAPPPAPAGVVDDALPAEPLAVEKPDAPPALPEEAAPAMELPETELEALLNEDVPPPAPAVDFATEALTAEPVGDESGLAELMAEVAPPVAPVVEPPRDEMIFDSKVIESPEVQGISAAGATSLLTPLPSAPPEQPADPAVAVDESPVQQAVRALKDGRHKEALHMYKELINNDPMQPDHYYNLSVACQKMNDIAGARAALERCLELAPDYYRAICNMAGIVYEEGDFSGAEELLTRAVQINPFDANSLQNLNLLKKKRLRKRRRKSRPRRRAAG